MPAALTLAQAHLALMRAKPNDATDYIPELHALFDDLVGPANQFGSAATADVGTVAGNIP